MIRPGNVFYRKPAGELPRAEKGEAAIIVDQEGKRYLDASGGALVVNVGHGRAEIADSVNEQIRKALPVRRIDTTIDEAKKMGSQAVFEQRYGEQVSVYSIGDFSLEICSGPHVENTGELGRFRIVKEEGISAGVRRIRAVLESADQFLNPRHFPTPWMNDFTFVKSALRVR